MDDLLSISPSSAAKSIILLISFTLIQYVLIKKFFDRANGGHGDQHSKHDRNNNENEIENHLNQSNNNNNNVDIYKLPYAPGPFKIPLIGNLFALRKYPTNPWAGFDAFSQKYGPICSLQLGAYSTILISSMEAIREVLIIKSEHFANRPHFYRHDKYFNNDRQNALALCDWNELHRQRRSIAHAAIIPRFGTDTFKRLSKCIQLSVEKFINELQSITNADNNNNGKTNILIIEKNSIIQLSCKIFFHFLLDYNVDDICGDDNHQQEDNVMINKEKLNEIAEKFDLIFEDINELYLTDFLPQFRLTQYRYYKRLANDSKWIHDQIETIVKKRLNLIMKQQKQEQDERQIRQKSSNNTDSNNNDVYDNKNNVKNGQDQSSNHNSNDDDNYIDQLLLEKQIKSSAKFLDMILEHYLENPKTFTWNQTMYEIADLVGGNSAVGNLLYRLLGHLVLNPRIQEKLHEQIKSISNENLLKNNSPVITIEDNNRLTLVIASIMETLRLTLSPIVPHSSCFDTSIQGYFVPKGTMILFNMYHLNLSEHYYRRPFEFDPFRFINPMTGAISKPEHFLPFSYGRRSCLGFKMVYSILSMTVAGLLLRYRLISESAENLEKIKQMLQPKGTLALPYENHRCYSIGLVEREGN